MEATFFPETSVDFRQTTLHYIPEEEERCMRSWSATKGMIITCTGWREKEREWKPKDCIDVAVALSRKL
jgi:hypothetical protein